MPDVAALAGVSKSLVSLVMRDEPGAGAETRRRVLDAAARLGYQPDSRARLLRSGRSRLLGVVFGIQHPFHGDLVTDLYTAAGEAGYELALSAVTPHRDEESAVTGLLQDRCEALIVLGPQSSAARLTRLAERLPVVAVARGVRSAAVGVVRNADADGLRLAVDHLAGRGHRRIAHIDGGRAPGAADRRRGYREAMHRHGLDAEIRIIPGGLTEEDGAAAARAMLGLPPAAGTASTTGIAPATEAAAAASPTGIAPATEAAAAASTTGIAPATEAATAASPTGRPTAVTVFNDRCATGVLDVLARAGVRVPEDVSVVGYDDSRLARLAHVDLTTIAQDTAAMACLAVDQAVARVEGRPVAARECIVPPRLVIRGTG
ncbi:LacI family DNA-binding transcriptional regulator [Actinoplanes sp. NPDC051343]|uniref:LacI family DNA-binding transcriptional regulator n=1 Tax=Actinoplanes sp. NPDC051343 TaxID=3363906 RepID=UPI0037B0A76B